MFLIIILFRFDVNFFSFMISLSVKIHEKGLVSTYIVAIRRRGTNAKTKWSPLQTLFIDTYGTNSMSETGLELVFFGFSALLSQDPVAYDSSTSRIRLQNLSRMCAKFRGGHTV